MQIETARKRANILDPGHTLGGPQPRRYANKRKVEDLREPGVVLVV